MLPWTWYLQASASTTDPAGRPEKMVRLFSLGVNVAVQDGTANSLSQDTSPAQGAEYYRLLRALTPRQRLRAACVATQRMRRLAEAGIRARMPGHDGSVRRELVWLLYGEAAVRRLELVLST